MNTLFISVVDTWTNGHLSTMITSVFKQLKNVLIMINEAKLKNYLVKTKRGKQFRDLDLPIDLTIDEPALLDELHNTAELFKRKSFDVTPSSCRCGLHYSAGVEYCSRSKYKTAPL